MSALHEEVEAAVRARNDAIKNLDDLVRYALSTTDISKSDLRRLGVTRHSLDVIVPREQRVERVGETTLYDPEILRRLASLRLAGSTFRQIAEIATAENLPTPRGGNWSSGFIGHQLRTQEGKKIMDRLRAEQRAIDPVPSKGTDL